MSLCKKNSSRKIFALRVYLILFSVKVTIIISYTSSERGFSTPPPPSLPSSSVPDIQNMQKEKSKADLRVLTLDTLRYDIPYLISLQHEDLVLRK